MHLNGGPRALLAFLPLLLAACTLMTPHVDRAVVATLAPTGVLRLAIYRGSPISMVRDPATGAAKGVGLDLGHEMADALGVQPVLVECSNNAETVAAMKEGRADFIFTNATPARATDIAFAPALLEMEQGYIVPPGSPLTSSDAVDSAGQRIGVLRGSTSERELPRLIRSATLVSVASLSEATQRLSDRSLDAFATNKSILYELADQLDGAIVLPGAYGRESIAIGIPKGRAVALPWVEGFGTTALDRGDVARAVARAGLRGAQVMSSGAAQR